MKKFLSSVVGAAGLAAALIPRAFAQLNLPPAPVAAPVIPISNTTDIYSAVWTIIDWLFWGLIVFSVIMALVAGYRYATSGGEPDKVSKAGKTLMYAAIAVVVALVAAGVPALISTFFGANISPGY